MQNFSYDINATALYLALSLDAGALTVDGSIRRDQQRGTGYSMTDVGTTGVWDRAGASRVNYSSSATSTRWVPTANSAATVRCLRVSATRLRGKCPTGCWATPAWIPD